MPARVAEHVVGRRLIGGRRVLRVDLHGVSVFGPRDAHTLIRWERIERIVVGEGVTVSSATASLSFPPGAFGLDATTLAERLEAARSIEARGDVIEQLGAGGG